MTGAGNMKSTFTTGEAALICRVSQQTVIRLFDQGHLAGFRVPGSKKRWITREGLLAFMQKNGIPPTDLDPEGTLKDQLETGG